MKTLLVIAHTPSSNSQALAKAIVAGAGMKDLTKVEVVERAPLNTGPKHLRQADAIILFTPENFGYMSGALKDMFDRCFYRILDHTQGMPYALCVRAGKDGTGTVRAVESITKGLGWKACEPPLILKGNYSDNFEHQAHEYGQIMAAGLDVGLW